MQESGVIDLETRPSDPYSVRVGFVMRDDRIYIDPTPDRGWNANLEADSAVRVRVGSRIYSATAVPVKDAGDLEGFEADRNVYRLDLAHEG